MYFTIFGRIFLRHCHFLALPLLFTAVTISALFPSTQALSVKTKYAKKSDKPWYRNTNGTAPIQLIVSLPHQRMYIYRNGELVIQTRVSTGRPTHSTPGGVFSILQKRREHYSNLYDNAPMPFMQRLTWSGIALHAGNVSRRYASHGCIRLPYNFARNLFRYTRRGIHVIIAHEKVKPKQITHKNLISPTPRLVPVETTASIKPIKISTSEQAPEQPKEERFKLLPTEAELKLARQKQEKARMDKSVQDAKDTLKKRKQISSSAYQAYKKENTNLVAQDNRHKRLTKQITWATTKLENSKISAEKGKERVLTWLNTQEEYQTKLYNKLLELNDEIAAWKPELDKSQETGEGLRQVKKKLKTLRWKHRRLRKQISRAEKKVKQAKTSAEKQKQTSDTQIAKREKHLAGLKRKLETFDVSYIPLKKERDKRKIAYEAAREKVKQSVNELKELSKKRSILLGKMQKTKRTIITEKQPLRILLTRSNRQHKVKDIQQSLNDLGYKLEKIDGIPGSETVKAIKSYQEDHDLRITGRVNDELVRSIRKKLGKEPLKTGHIYVRQGFIDIFNAPINIAKPEKSLGTHFYTVMDFDKKAKQARWNAVTVKSKKHLSKLRSIKRRKGKPVEISVPLPSNAKEALDRIELPKDVYSFLSKRLTPGSSMIIADKNSHETGQYTDFIVLAGR